MLKYHTYIEELIIEDNNIDIFFDENILSKPIKLTNDELVIRKNNYNNINNFFEISKEIYKNIIFQKSETKLKKLLTGDSVVHVPIEFIRKLPLDVWTRPHFFRTDESRGGKIFEIQCPGSGWGDLILLQSLYNHFYKNEFEENFTAKEKFIKSIKSLFGSETVTILHLLDNSSNPSSMKYFIKKTTPPLRYWGYTKNVKNSECEFIRSHSVYGLIAENLFKSRLIKASEGKLKFDLPPLLIFDQKMILALPFIDDTKDNFSDEIRDSLVYSYPLTSKGFRDESGQWVDINSFLKRPSSSRKYFLKYAGCDTSINWGSRAVYRLDSNNASKLLDIAIRDYDINRPWIIQPDCSEKEKIEYYTRDNSYPIIENITAKYSTFYGPNEIIGVRTHHRRSTKVHGQPDAVAGLAY